MTCTDVKTKMEIIRQVFSHRRIKITSLCHHLTSHFNNQTALFSQWDELIRWHQTHLWMLPAHQDFTARQPMFCAVHHWLDVRDKFMMCQPRLHHCQRSTDAAERQIGHGSDKQTQQRE